MQHALSTSRGNTALRGITLTYTTVERSSLDYIAEYQAGILPHIHHGIDANESGRFHWIISTIINLDLRRLQTAREIHSNLQMPGNKHPRPICTTPHIIPLVQYFDRMINDMELVYRD